MRFEINPTQFGALQKVLAVAPGVVLQMKDAKSGTLTTSDVILSCVYDGAAALYVNVESRRSFKAKLASASMVESKVSEMLKDYLYSLDAI
jgi:hypothetical protein